MMRELKIKEQLWTIDNLDVTCYRNGDVIPNVEDAEEWKNFKTGAWCYFENNESNNGIHGKLYNYYAIIDPRGLAPLGYRIPQHYDWLMLSEFGGRLKSKNEWNDIPVFDWLVPFNAKPGGYRSSDGNFMYKNEAVGWWTSEEEDVKTQGHIAHWLYKNDQQLGWKPFFKNDGFYVRCIKETYKSVQFLINDNLDHPLIYISVKYTPSTSFQDLLNLIYNTCLSNNVKRFSYGKEWIIQIYDGERIDNLEKKGAIDNRLFDDALLSTYRMDYKLIISRMEKS
ncbi:MAG: FISUMP domain-containing protein [Gelidibacter sp.]